MLPSQMAPAAVAAQADLLARAWSPPAAPSSGRLTAAIFATLRNDPELFGLAAEIPAVRLPALLFSAAANYLVRQLVPDPLWRCFPMPGSPQPQLHPRFARDFRDFCLDHRDALRELFAGRRYRMSEVARCAHLLPALAAAAGGRDVALVEVGAGAGFALHLDRFGYVYRDGRGMEHSVGDRTAPLTIETAVRGGRWPPVQSAPPRIVARIGVDPEPVALVDPDVRRWLAACVPPEAGAVTRFEHAAAIAAAEPVAISRGEATDALDLVAGLPEDALVCLLDAHVHVSFAPAEVARFAAFVAAAGRMRDLDWLSLNPFVPLGPHAQRSVVGIDVPAAMVERSRSGGAFSVLGHLAWRQGRARPFLLAVGHPSGAWLQWLGDDS